MQPENLHLDVRGDEVCLHVKVVPGASRSRIIGLHGDALKVGVSAPPQRGKANQAVIRLLADTLGVRTSQLRVISGGQSPRKTVAVHGLSSQQILERLRPLL